MNNILKKVPDKKIIDILSSQITQIGLPLIKDVKSGNITYSMFNFITSNLPKNETIPEGLTRPYNTINMNCTKTQEVVEVKKILNADQCTNTIIYPKNIFMNWHTNSNNPGKRTYITFCKSPGVFRYFDIKTKKIIDDFDNIGWTQREFIVSKTDVFWHCVWSNSIRFSYGFNLKNANSL